MFLALIQLVTVGHDKNGLTYHRAISDVMRADAGLDKEVLVGF